MEQPPPSQKKSPPATRRAKQPQLTTFHLSCWILALAAFIQLATLGTGLAMNWQKNVAPAEEKIVTRYVTVPAARAVTATPPRVKKLSKNSPGNLTAPPVLQPIPPSAAALIPPQVTDRPPRIADPVVERLVNEAREARVHGDNMSAITKLEEALNTTPGEPNCLYEFASTFEDMGIYDKASDYYLQVYQLGPVKAGSLWKKSGAKLETGFKPETQGLTSLGVVRNMPAREVPEGTRHGVLVPINVTPGREFDPSLLQTKVHFYEKRNGKIEAAQISVDGADWLSEPLDWADGEELVEVWYVIPPIDGQEKMLYGARQYYGYMAELYYNNELLDMRFFPRTLMSETSPNQRPQADPQIDPLIDGFDPGEGFDPEDYNPGDPLLPPLPSY